MVETNYKYVSPIIAKTNKDKIIRLRQENPDYTLLQIGKQVGVSRERVIVGDKRPWAKDDGKYRE